MNKLDRITLDAVLNGDVTMRDLCVTRDALHRQADIAEQCGRRQLSENLLRASELVDVPEELILRIYNALRPGRASTGEVQALADQLERGYGALRCANFLREAAEKSI